MRIVPLMLCTLLGGMGLVTGPVEAQQTRPDLVAVFAHPDDERIVGPLLARYAREGHDVHLVIATDGGKGVREHAGIPAGDSLANVRARESRCATETLGIHPPILLGLEDGGLASFASLTRLRRELRRVLAELDPDVIISFGPEGGTGHPDHRLVGAVVTELVQAGGEGIPAELYYPSLPAERMDDAPPASPQIATIRREYLSVAVPFAPRDLEATRRAFACHRSQYTGPERDAVMGYLEHGFDGAVHLRPWNGAERRTDLFGATGPIQLLIRSDDAGMTHAVNQAKKALIETGMPVSVSIMFVTPWWQEMVEILRNHPDVSVGVHIALNSEWKNYRWGPVVGQNAARTLVDEDGFFFPSAQDLYENDPDPAEAEQEIRAQIERALRTGLEIDYVDFHMGTVRNHPALMSIATDLAAEYGLLVSGSNGEVFWDPQYRAVPDDKPDSLAVMVGGLEAGFNVLIAHPGLNTPEMAALEDMNTAHPLESMAVHRQGELDALRSATFQRALTERRVELITYRDLRAMLAADSAAAQMRGQ